MDASTFGWIVILAITVSSTVYGGRRIRQAIAEQKTVNTIAGKARTKARAHDKAAEKIFKDQQRRARRAARKGIVLDDDLDGAASGRAGGKRGSRRSTTRPGARGPAGPAGPAGHAGPGGHEPARTVFVRHLMEEWRLRAKHKRKNPGAKRPARDEGSTMTPDGFLAGFARLRDKWFPGDDIVDAEVIGDTFTPDEQPAETATPAGDDTATKPDPPVTDPLGIAAPKGTDDMSKATPPPPYGVTRLNKDDSPVVTTHANGWGTGGTGEDLIAGIKSLVGRAERGDINDAHFVIKTLAKLGDAVGKASARLGTRLGEPDKQYGKEITEPLATAAAKGRSAASDLTSSDAAMTALKNMTVAELSQSSRRAPHHSQLNGGAP